jgi:hypothetical protein
VLQVVTSLTGLKRFSLCVLGESDKLVLLRLTQLQHLTALTYDGYLSGVLTRLEFSSKVGLMPCMACMITDHDRDGGSVMLLCTGCGQQCLATEQPPLSNGLCNRGHLFVDAFITE